MGTQIIVFTLLLIVLFRNRRLGSGQSSCMSILITIFSLLNGLLCIIRVNSQKVNTYSYIRGVNTYQMVYLFESICFIGAMWFYTIRYYQISRDLKLLTRLHSEATSTGLQSEATSQTKESLDSADSRIN